MSCANPNHPTIVRPDPDAPYRPELKVGHVFDGDKWQSALINAEMCCEDAVIELVERTASYEIPMVRHPEAAS